MMKEITLRLDDHADAENLVAWLRVQPGVTVQGEDAALPPELEAGIAEGRDQALRGETYPREVLEDQLGKRLG